MILSVLLSEFLVLNKVKLSLDNWATISDNSVVHPFEQHEYKSSSHVILNDNDILFTFMCLVSAPPFPFLKIIDTCESNLLGIRKQCWDTLAGF